MSNIVSYSTSTPVPARQMPATVSSRLREPTQTTLIAAPEVEADIREAADEEASADPEDDPGVQAQLALVEAAEHAHPLEEEAAAAAVVVAATETKSARQEEKDKEEEEGKETTQDVPMVLPTTTLAIASAAATETTPPPPPPASIDAESYKAAMDTSIRSDNGTGRHRGRGRGRGQAKRRSLTYAGHLKRQRNQK